MSAANVVRLCDAYDEAEALFYRSGSVDRSRRVDAAKRDLLEQVRASRVAARTCALGQNTTRHDSFGVLAYFSSWLALRGGFRY